MTSKQLIARVGFFSMVFTIVGTLLFGMVASMGWLPALVIVGIVIGIMLVVAAFLWCIENMS